MHTPHKIIRTSMILLSFAGIFGVSAATIDVTDIASVPNSNTNWTAKLTLKLTPQERIEIPVPTTVKWTSRPLKNLLGVTMLVNGNMAATLTVSGVIAPQTTAHVTATVKNTNPPITAATDVNYLDAIK